MSVSWLFLFSDGFNSLFSDKNFSFFGQKNIFSRLLGGRRQTSSYNNKSDALNNNKRIEEKKWIN